MDLFDFGILLQALANNMKVGMLTVRGESRVKHLQLDRTRLVAMYTEKPKVSLGKVLYHHRAIEKGALRDAIAAVGPASGPDALARHLLERGLVTPEQIRRANHYQMLEETLELFYWKNVGFKFTNGGTGDTLPGKGLVRIGEPLEVDSLLLQCTKTIDDIAKFDEVTPSLRDVYELHVDSLETLMRLVPDDGQREFILLIDGVRDMREVLRDMRMNRFDVLELFYRFRKQGRIRPKNAFELLMLAENRRKEFSLEKRARVYERVSELGVEGFEVLLPLAETYEEMGANDKAAALFARHARRCRETGDAEGALAAAQRATRLEPDDPDLREAEIDLLLAAGRKAEAGAAYKALSDIRQRRGDPAAARAALKRAAKLDPSDPVNWLRLADMLEAAGRTRRAAARLRRAGDALRARGETDRAADAFRRASALCGSAWTVRHRLVRCLHERGDTEGAVAELATMTEFVLEGQPRLPDRVRRVRLTRIEAALREIGGLTSRTAIDVGRGLAKLGDPDAALNLLHDAAEALWGRKRHRDVIEAMDAYIELAPDDVDARRAIARAHVALGETTRAASQLRRAGSLLVAQRRWTEARAVYEEMLSAEPGSADAHAGLAGALLELGEERLASTHFHRAALLHRGSGKVDQAIAFFREAVEKSPADADLLDEFCEVLLATERRGDKLQALSALVELRMMQNQPARAAIALTRIIEIDPRYPGAKNILQEAARQLSRMAEASEEIPVDAAKEVLAQIRAGAGRALKVATRA